jgi:hypothetical protein
MLLQIEERAPQGPPPSGLTPWALGFAGWLPAALAWGLDRLGHAHEMVLATRWR